MLSLINDSENPRTSLSRRSSGNNPGIEGVAGFQDTTEVVHHSFYAALLTQGLDGAGEALRILVNEVSKIERAHHLNVQPCEHSGERQGSRTEQAVKLALAGKKSGPPRRWRARKQGVTMCKNQV